MECLIFSLSKLNGKIIIYIYIFPKVIFDIPKMNSRMEVNIWINISQNLHAFLEYLRKCSQFFICLLYDITYKACYFIRVKTNIKATLMHIVLNINKN